MNIKNIGITAITLVALEATGFPASGLVAATGMGGVAVGALLIMVGAEREAGHCFATGLGCLAGSSVLAAAGGAVRMHLDGAALGPALTGLSCLAVPIVGLFGLNLLARGLAASRVGPLQSGRVSSAERML